MYTPLNRESREIRLLEIVFLSSLDDDSTVGAAAAGVLTSTTTATTSCKLHTVQLDAAPRYAALSYVWGDASVTENILVDGQAVAVTVNLASALRHIRGCWERLGYEPTGFRLWADAVCINQQDLNERASQVQLMGHIYESAEVTFAWLSSTVGKGEGDNEVEDASFISPAIALLNIAYKLADRYATQPLRSTDANVHWVDDEVAFQGRVDWAGFIPALLEAQPFSFFEGGPGGAVYTDYTLVEPWASLERMCFLPYWKRVWVYQEALLARTYYLVSPGEMIDSTTARMAMMAVERTLAERMHEVPAAQAAICASFQNMLLGEVGNISSFLTTTRQMRYISSSKTAAESTARSQQYYRVMTRCGLLMDVLGGDRQSTDPLDQVYGALGYTGIDVVPDYTASVSKVYLDFAHKVVYEMGTSDDVVVTGWDAKTGLCFLSACAAGIGNSLGLPTWAPAFYLSRLQHLHIFGVNHRPPARLTDSRRIVSRDMRLWAPAARVEALCRCRSAGPHALPTQATIELFEEVLQSHGPTYTHGDAGSGTMPTVEALSRVLMLQRAGAVDLEGLAGVFYGLSDWDTSPPPPSTSMVYEQLENCLQRFGEVADNDTAHSHIGWFLSNWQYLQMESFESLQLIETVDGYLGMAGGDARVDDVVYVIKGCPTPILLRPEGDHFLFVGPCFVLGLMNDEINGLLESGHTKVDFVEIQ